MKQMHELNKQCYITFYGDWIGRPCDNVYLVKTIEYRIYEKTNEGLTRTEDGHTDVIKVESPYFAVNVSMLNWNG